jgi:penicillin amidase
MLLAVLAAALMPASFGLTRDSFGAPIISAPSHADAMKGLGYATGMDRLWQLETSRRIAHGRMAEIDPGAEAADRRTLRFAYTDEELRAQMERQPAEVQAVWQSYAEGVNQAIDQRKAEQSLPPGYAAAGIEPEPWRVEDSAAIGVMMARRFGQGGAGELRNLALLEMLKAAGEDAMLDAFDDLAWQNDPAAIPTVRPEEDPLAQSHPSFPDPTRQETIAHLKSLPARSILELAGAVMALDTQDLDLVASRYSAPYKLGSYAAAVGAGRSLSGRPMLLHGPQMGHATPSIVAEATLACPEFRVAGMHVPGLPAILIGASESIAWTLTTGVADIEDDCFAPLGPSGGYLYGGREMPIRETVFTRRRKDGTEFTFAQERTHVGPVLLESRVGKAIYTRRSALWSRELDAIASIYGLYSAQTPADVQRITQPYNASFNLFFATAQGEIGFQYVGHAPVRAEGFDPRLPWPLTPETEWKRTLTPQEMPHVFNPPSGLIANWNNKPAAWWANGDTPAWGSVFRNSVLLDALGEGPLSRARLLDVIRESGEMDTFGSGAFLAEVRAAAPSLEGAARQIAAGVDGSLREGDPGAALLSRFYGELRRQLAGQRMPGLLSLPQADQVLGASWMRAALDGKTKTDFLAGRTREQVIAAALKSAAANPVSPVEWSLRPPAINYPGSAPIPFSNRATYIQITEMTPDGPLMWSVAGPGSAETGPHAQDQIELVRGWRLRPRILAPQQ